MLVTGFFDLSRFESRRTSRDEWAKRTEWIRAQLYPFLFARVEGEELPFEIPSQWTVLTVPPPDFTDLPRVEANLAQSRIPWDPLKDTPRYFCLMRYRIDWMRAAAAVAPKREPLTWVDIGIPHAADDKLALAAHLPPPRGKIRICEISYVPRYARVVDEYYSRHWWPVGGGLWSARGPEIEWLAERMAEEWTLSLEAGYVATDEMLIGRVAIRHPEKFSMYYGDHPTLIGNVGRVRGSHRLITEMALRALEDGNREAARARFLALAAGLD